MLRPLILVLLSALAAQDVAARGKAKSTDTDIFIKAGAGAYGTRWRYPAFKAVIDVPPAYQRTAPQKNSDIEYHFAMRHKKAAVEVRLQFAAWAETPRMAKQRKECQAQNAREPGSCMMADLEAASSVWGQTIAANMNDGSPVPFNQFPPDAVKEEFGADWGFVSDPIELDPRRDFNKGFSFGQVVMLHRKGIGKIYRILMADTFEHLATVDRGNFYNARFEGAKPPGLIE